MNRYKFSEEEVPYGILEQFGLRREMIGEMIGDLPVDVLQAIHSGRRSPVLPIRVDDSEGNTIHARTRFSLVRREDGTADVLFYPVLVESRLERFSEEQKQRLLHRRQSDALRIQRRKGRHLHGPRRQGQKSHSVRFPAVSCGIHPESDLLIKHHPRP